MQTLDLVEIEKKLGKKIRKNTLSIGWDSAERYSGASILITDNSKIYIELGKISTDPKEDIKNRMNYFEGALDKYVDIVKKVNNYKICVIEDAFLKFNVKVLKDLTRFSTIVWTKFHKICDYTFFILPNTARSQVGFSKNEQIIDSNIEVKKITKGKNKGKNKKVDIKILVKDYIEQTFGLKIEDFDEADSFILAMAGLLR